MTSLVLHSDKSFVSWFHYLQLHVLCHFLSSAFSVVYFQTIVNNVIFGNVFNKHKEYQARATDRDNILNRWKAYFSRLLNGSGRDVELEKIGKHTTEVEIPNPSATETETAL